MEYLDFNLPRGDKFKLPADWWNEAGMQTFQRQSASYRFQRSPDILLVRIDSIEPLRLRHRLDKGGLRRRSFVSILRKIASESAMPPIQLEELPPDGEYAYGIHRGTHRFYASVAVGFSHIPAVLIE
jgi:hypothetical protein